MKYDVIIIGAGPGGIFSAYELTKHNEKQCANSLQFAHCFYVNIGVAQQKIKNIKIYCLKTAKKIMWVTYYGNLKKFQIIF